VTRLAILVCAIAAAIVAAPPARAEIYQFSERDGTVHFTNAPTDSRYRRTGFASGTSAGWLRLPGGDAARYAAEIRDAAERYRVPEKLVSAVIRVESAFNARAVSRKGARGLMQLMPETASQLGVRNTFDPHQNIDGGVRHLRGLIERFPNNLPLALAAYNAGERAVAAHQGIPPYAETRDYVTRVLYFFDGNVDGISRTTVYRRVEDDGTVTYTNIPPRGRR
jgi:soluble lytic murein transglycosylase-like protein